VLISPQEMICLPIRVKEGPMLKSMYPRNRSASHCRSLICSLLSKRYSLLVTRGKIGSIPP